MTSEELRPRLDRVQELSKKLNAATDNAGRVIQGVESFLSDVCHLGIHSSIQIAHDDSESTTWTLCYNKFGYKYRFFILETHSGMQELPDGVLWANCSRDLKLLAYEHLPHLLDKLIDMAERRLDRLEANTKTIEEYLPPIKDKKKGATS